MPDIDDYPMPEVTPRQSLQHPINRARRAEGSLPMRFDTRGREEPVPEVITPREAEEAPPTGGILRYSAGPFIKKGVEAAKEFASGWETSFGKGRNTQLRSLLDEQHYVGAGSQASKATRAAMAEAGPPTRYDLSTAKPTFSASKPYKVNYSGEKGRMATESVTDFPVRITIPEQSEPVKIGTFQRTATSKRGGAWRFEAEPNMLVEPKRDQPVLKKALTDWLRTNKMGSYADELKDPAVLLW